MPFLVISPYARKNYVDHTVTDQSSVLRFIEDDFSLGRIDQSSPKTLAAGGSFDQIAGSLDSLFDFDHDHDKKFDRDDDRGRGDHDDNRPLLILDPATGEPVHR
jgi:phospholipase C